MCRIKLLDVLQIVYYVIVVIRIDTQVILPVLEEISTISILDVERDGLIVASVPLTLLCGLPPAEFTETGYGVIQVEGD
jgi:hypothetical protein